MSETGSNAINLMAGANTNLPRYGWWGWQAETELDNDDDRENVWFLTITDCGEELAVIVHRTCPDENGVEKYPIDGPLADEKYKRCQRIVQALNHHFAEGLH